MRRAHDARLVALLRERLVPTEVKDPLPPLLAQRLKPVVVRLLRRQSRALTKPRKHRLVQLSPFLGPPP